MKTLSRLLLSVVLFVGFLADSSFGKAFGPRAASPAAFSATNAAWYSLAGAPSDSTYLLRTGVALIADRSGNSAVNGIYFPPIAGNEISTPDAAPNRITGDIDVRLYVTWNAVQSADNSMCSKWSASKAWAFNLDAVGTIRLYYSLDGSAALSVASTVTVAYAPGTTSWYRFTRVQSTGVVTFYTSTDGTTWTQVGATVVASAGSALFNSTSAVFIGGIAGTPVSNFFVRRFELRSVIGGSVAQQADPSVVAKLASSWVSSTGETWTIATSGDLGSRICGARDLVQLTAAKQPAFSVVGGYNTATFDGSNDYMKAAAFSLNQPETIYFAGSQVTWTAGDTLFDGNAANSGHLQQDTSTPRLRAFAGASLAFISPTLATPSVLTTVFNGAAGSIRWNLGTAVTGNVGASNMGGFTLGVTGDNAGTFCNITFNEALLRSAADDTTTQNALTAYEMLTWGITP